MSRMIALVVHSTSTAKRRVHTGSAMYQAGSSCGAVREQYGAGRAVRVSGYPGMWWHSTCGGTCRSRHRLVQANSPLPAREQRWRALQQPPTTLALLTSC
jgi:hypothetical protein